MDGNRLYHGGNLDVLRERVRPESVGLIYLDPPFNSQATYNVLLRNPAGERSKAQTEAFEDTWRWNKTAEDAFDQAIRSGNSAAADTINAVRSFLGENDIMAYLAMMPVRLIELLRVLKSTGSLYLHFDPIASHYLKIMLDFIFSPGNFRSGSIWRRSPSHDKLSRQFGPVHDTSLFYGKPERAVFKPGLAPYTKAISKVSSGSRMSVGISG
jgi:adenine specific DNA methylase Mod